MIKCFLIPMTEPPYSRENPQRPKYTRELQISWTGVPLFSSKMYVIKANSTPEKLNLLQESEGVIDFPNIDDDWMERMPEQRKAKDRQIRKILKIGEKRSEQVRDFINRAANSEVNHGWDKNKVFVK